MSARSRGEPQTHSEQMRLAVLSNALARKPNNMAWHDQDPRRLQKEVAIMESGSRAALRRVGGRLVWSETLRSEVTGRTFDVVIEYPDRFPHAPPRAFVVRPTVDGAPHRLIDGSLCLWNNPSAAAGVKTTALAVRNRVVLWCLAFEVWERTGTWHTLQH